MTSIEYYVRAGFRRAKAQTTMRTEYYDLMYSYEDFVLQNGFVSDAGIRPVPLSTISNDDVLMHLHRLFNYIPEDTGTMGW